MMNMAQSITPALVIINMQEDYAKSEQFDIGELSWKICELMKNRYFGTIVAVQQWYPENHVSFAESHKSFHELDTISVHGRPLTLMRRHCVSGTEGAKLLPGLPWTRANAIIRTGMHPGVATYSAFREGWNEKAEQPTTGLGGYLRSRGISEVYLVGLFRELSVLRSAEDGNSIGFRMHVIWDGTKALEKEKDEEVRRALRVRGVRIIECVELM